MDNQSQSKKAMELIRAEVEGKVAGCVACKGKGYELGWPGYSPPCFYCKPWRDMLRGLCWHIVPSTKAGQVTKCTICGQAADSPLAYNLLNPDLTRAMTGSRLTLVVMMERAGLWIPFWMHLCQKHAHAIGDEFIATFTDGENLLPAVIAYLKGRLG